MQVVNNAEAEPAVVRQRVGSVTYTAQAALQELQRQAFKKAKWSQYFYPAFMPNEPDGPVYLICKACNLNLSAANPSDTLKHTQNGRCKGPPAATTTTLNHASSGPSVASSSGQTGIRDFQPSAGQIKAAKDELAMYFYTSETPFGRVENVHLRKAFSLLRVQAAIRLLSAHVTTAAAERNWSAWGRLYQGGQRSRMAIETAAALIYVKGNSTTQQRDDYEICLDIQE